jgi:hypothetical protein
LSLGFCHGKNDFICSQASLSLLIQLDKVHGGENLVEVDRFSSNNPVPLEGGDALWEVVSNSDE